MAKKTALGARQIPIISIRPRISERGKTAAEKILLYRLLTGEGVADVTINQLVDDSLEVHAQALEDKYGPVKKLQATA